MEKDHFKFIEKGILFFFVIISDFYTCLLIIIFPAAKKVNLPIVNL